MNRLVITLFILFGILFSGQAYSQMVGMGMDPSMLNALTDLQSRQSPQDKLEAVEAMFIEEMFIKPILQSNNLFKFEEDEEDDVLLNTSAYNDMFNAIYIRQVSKMLAKQDILGFSKYDFERE